MDTNTEVGGFAGDPAEAFTPPAASGCCGGAFTPATTSSTAASGCCGSAATKTPSPDTAREEAGEATGCCG